MAERPILFSGPMVRAIIEGRKTQTRRLVRGMPPAPAADCHPSHVASHATPYFDAYCGARKSPENPRGMSGSWCWWQVDDRQCLPTIRCPYGVPGDALWVRETWQEFFEDELPEDRRGGPAGRMGCPATPQRRSVVAYWADGPLDHPQHGSANWRPSIHMPRWASRLTLAVKAVRVERLQDISEGDIYAEGIELTGTTVACMKEEERAARGAFATLWDSINAKRREPSHIANRRRKGKATQRYDASHPEQPTPYAWANNPFVWVVEFEKEATRA